MNQQYIKLKYKSMRNHLLHFSGNGRIVPIERGTSSDEYGRIQTQFLTDAGGDPKGHDYADFVTLYDDCKIGNVLYDEELAGSAGMSFRLWVLPDVPQAEIDAAKAKLRRDRDVVRMQVVKISQMI